MSKSVNKLIDEQIKRWEMEKKTASIHVEQKINVITISRESGSQGFNVAAALCRETGFDLFHHEIVDAMVENSETSRKLLETLDEKAMNVVDDVVSNFINTHHLWPDDYSKLLFKILGTISNHGKAVILGRGANCILDGDDVLKIRIVAPLSAKQKVIQHSKDFNKEDATKYITSTEANRAAFVKRYCNCDITDAANYDLVLNTGNLTVEKAVQVIMCAMS